MFVKKELAVLRCFLFCLSSFCNYNSSISSDLEHKPDILWPNSEQIHISVVSECGSYMALGLKNGTVVVWNVYRGENFALKFTSLERFTVISPPNHLATT